MMWQAINEEREESSNITHIKARCVYSLINEVLHVFFEELVTVGEAPTDFVLLTTEQLHLCYIGFLGPPAMIDTKASCPN